MKSLCKYNSRRGQVPAPENRFWHLGPHGSAVSVQKDTEKGIRNLLPVNKAMLVAGESLHEGLERPVIHKAVKVKPVLSWRPQDVRRCQSCGIPVRENCSINRRQ